MNKILEVLRKTLKVLTPAQLRLSIIVFILSCMGSVLECVGVSVIIPLVSVIQDPSWLSESQNIFNFNFLSRFEYEQIVVILVSIIILLYIFKNSFFIFQSWVRVKFACKIQREMTVKMLKTSMNRGYKYFLDINFGEFIRNVAGDASAVYGVINCSFKLVSETLTILFICAFMFITDYRLAFVIMILAIGCVLLTFFLFRKKAYNASLIARKYGTKASQIINEIYLGIKDIILFRKQVPFVYEYEKNTIQTQKAQCTAAVAGESPAYIIEGVCVTGMLLSVCIRIVLFGSGPEFIAVLAAFAVGAFRILPCLGRISASMTGLTGAYPQVDALYNNILESDRYVKEHPELNLFDENELKNTRLIDKYFEAPSNIPKTVFSTGKFQEAVEIKNVSFFYNEELGNVIDNVSLTINKGDSIAFIGESGAGKTTLADIILGLLIPQKGVVTMDGINIRDISEKWADTISFVPQMVFLSDSSIRKNVAFGESDVDIDDELVIDALKKAVLLDFVETLPNGINTEVGDRGVRLSGGQRQRIAIARALYHRPEILVLDEATSALDNDTESVIMDAINSLYGQVTLIIVAHRLTTIKRCDKIYEIKDNGIIIRDKGDILG